MLVFVEWSTACKIDKDVGDDKYDEKIVLPTYIIAYVV